MAGTGCKRSKIRVTMTGLFLLPELDDEAPTVEVYDDIPSAINYTSMVRSYDEMMRDVMALLG